MRRASLLLALTLSALFVAVPAVAGGPTSVLVTLPGEGRSTALYYTDPAYDRLWAALRVGEEVRPARNAPEDLGGDAPPVVLTWLIHDVTVWRVDHVYVQDVTTYVLTQQNVGGGPLSEGTSVLHEGAPGLDRVLDQVLSSVPGPEAVPTPEPLAEPPAARPGDPTSPLPVEAAGLGGLVAGVVGTLVALAVRRPREPATPEPEPEPASDELVWP